MLDLDLRWGLLNLDRDRPKVGSVHYTRAGNIKYVY